MTKYTLFSYFLIAVILHVTFFCENKAHANVQLPCVFGIKNTYLTWQRKKTEEKSQRTVWGKKVLYEKFWDTVCNEMKAKAWKITAKVNAFSKTERDVDDIRKK